MDCSDDEVLAGYVSGELDETARMAIEAHLDRCAECSETVAMAARTSFSSKRSVGAEAGAPSHIDLAAGAQIGRHVVLHEIGRGAMGVVLAAYDVELDRRVALKVVAHRPGKSPHREARAMARLTHPNVVPVYDVMSFGTFSVIAMEYVAGRNLRQWLNEERRSVASICRVLLEAGRGLLAAHEAGIVHCDLKPDNILVGDDGRVLVTDFGLAHPVAPAPRSLGGTLGYMAPEQLDQGFGTLASDIFAFSVTSIEALSGIRPDAGADTPPENLDAQLWAVLEPGLRRRPGERPASLRPQLEQLDLRLHPRARAPWRLTAFVAIAAIALTSWSLSDRATSPAQDMCQRADARVASVWGNAQRDQLRTALRRIDTRSVEDTLGRAEAAIDAYVDTWQESYVDTCEATHKRGEQSSALLDLRMTCLNDRLASLHAAVSVLSERPDRDVLNRALRTLDALPAIAQCARIDTLQMQPPLPTDPQRRQVVRDLIKRTYEADTLLHAGKFDDARELLKDIESAVAEHAHPPLTSHFHHAFAVLLQNTEQYEQAMDHLRLAARSASASNDDNRLARVLNLTTGVQGYRMAQLESGLIWAEAAELAMLRADDPRVVWEFHHSRGTVLFTAGKYEEARREFLLAIRHLEDAKGPAARELLLVLDWVGTTFFRQKRYDQAVAYHERAIAVGEQTLGAHHYFLGNPLNNLGLVYMQRSSDHGRALDSFRRAQSLIVEGLGADSVRAALMRANIGQVLAFRGRYDEAEAEYRAALSILSAKLRADHPIRAEMQASIAHITSRRGDLVAAIALQERAIELRKQLGEDHPQVYQDRYNLAGLLCQAGRHDAGLAHLRAVMDFHRGTDGEATWRPQVLLAQAGCELRRDQPARAAALARDGIAVMSEDTSPEERAFAEALLARASYDLGERAMALRSARAALAALEAAQVADSELAELRTWLGERSQIGN